MEEVIFSAVLMVFPILMYLVFSCYNILANKKMQRVVFIMTIITSLYVSLKYGYSNRHMIMLCNIPILICYFKKECLLGIILSIAVAIFSYYMYDVSVNIVIIKYLSYLFSYVLLVNNREFKYLFLKISSVIQGFFVSFEYFMRTYEGIGKVVNLMINVSVIYLITFFCIYLFKIADDISNMYLTVNKINDENKLKNALFKLTHEIKNPIAVCKGYLDMINLDDTKRASRYIGIIKSEIDRSLGVMADFMEYSKIKINKEVIDLGMLTDDIYESFSILIKGKNIKFNYHNDYDELYIMGDYDRLKQVFINVLKNSVEAIEDGGIINLDICKRKDDVTVCVSDNGIGMNEEELNNVKEMFYTTKRNGTGLGVALSNEIIVAHSGKMEYESEKNVGTRCIITLPM
jgi:two-component system sporulation sensor kinase B